MKPVRVGSAIKVVYLFFAFTLITLTLAWEGLIFSKITFLKDMRAIYVVGHSMEPNIHSRDVLIFRNTGGSGTNVKKGNIVAVDYLGYYWDKEGKAPRTLVKRVVGMPREEISAVHGNVISRVGRMSWIYVDSGYQIYRGDYSMRFFLKKDQYFVMGDNRTFSVDSRAFGPVPSYKITAVEVARVSGGTFANLLFLLCTTR